MNRIIVAMEAAGGVALAAVMLIVTASAFGRYAFNSPLVDGDDLARLVLGPAIFWGFAGACRHGEHVRVDLLWEAASVRLRSIIDRFATGFTFVVVAAMATTAARRVLDLQASREGTYELRLPLWPSFAASFVGLAAGTLVLGWLLLRRRGEPDDRG
ncbi:MAG: TRAP transporter small permease [Lautropia sp.]